MKTDFFTRSSDTGRHPAYDVLVNKVMSIVTDPKQMATYSYPDQIAEVVYEAATVGKDQLRYIAGSRTSLISSPAVLRLNRPSTFIPQADEAHAIQP